MYQKQNDLLTVDTVLARVEDKGTSVLLEDTKKDYYSFFKEKQDGSPTAAASSFHGFNPGDAITIVYKEVPYKNKTIRSCVKFKIPENGPVVHARPMNRNSSNTNSRTSSTGNTSTFTAPMGSKDEIIGVLALVKATGSNIKDLQDVNTWQQYINAYRKGLQVILGNHPVVDVEATVHNSGQSLVQNAAVNPVNSTQESEINVEDIPF